MSTQDMQPQTFDDSSDFAFEQPPQNPLILVHKAMRGRYHYAVLIAILLAVPAALITYKSLPTKFASVGLVEVQQELESLLYRIPENERLLDVSGYAFTQAEYLRSRRVINLAATSPGLRDAGWPAGNEGIQAIIDALEVIPSRRGRTIRVQATHSNPLFSQLCVNAVLDAYVEIHGANVGLSVSDKQRELTSLIQLLERELQTSRDAAFRLADEFGADTLDRRHTSRLNELDRYDSLIAQHEDALINAQAQLDSASANPEPDVPDLIELADTDSHLALLLQARDELLAQQQSLSERFGENHRGMKQIVLDLQSLDARVDSRVLFLVELRQNQDGSNIEQTSGLTLEVIQARLAEYLSTRERTREEVRELGRRIRQIDGLQEQAADTRTKLNDATKRLSELEIEMRNNRTERVFIAQRGDFPLAPTSDKRIPAAAAAALAGFGGAFGMIFLYGFLNPTYRYIDEIENETRSLPLLGTLPDFDSDDPSCRDLAAHSVHHIRNTVQLQASRLGLKVFTITSAAPNDGKTSFVMALGTSFAAAGQSVVLVDCDFVGLGLSRALHVFQEEGLAEMCSSEDANGFVRHTGVPNLDVLPAGKVDHLEHTRLSPERVRPVLEKLRAQYELVLIDTGPLLGSLEAGVVSSLSDSVILTVSRGQGMRLVTAAADKLQRMQARCAGVVFNRAAPSDFKQSVSHTSIRSHSQIPSATNIRHSAPEDARSALMEAVAGTAVAQERETAHE